MGIIGAMGRGIGLGARGAWAAGRGAGSLVGDIATLPGGRTLMMGGAGGVVGGVSGFAGSDSINPNTVIKDTLRGAFGGAVLGMAGSAALTAVPWGAKKLAGRYSDNSLVQAGTAFLGRNDGYAGAAIWEASKNQLGRSIEKPVSKFAGKAAQGLDIATAVAPGGIASTKLGAKAARQQSRSFGQEAQTALRRGDMSSYENLAMKSADASLEGKRLTAEFGRMKGTAEGAAQWKAYKKYGSVSEFLDRELPRTGIGGMASGVVRAGIHSPASLAFGALGLSVGGMALSGTRGVVEAGSGPKASVAYSPENMMLNEAAGMVSPSPGTGLSTGYGFNSFAQSTSGLVQGLHQGRHS